MYFSLPFITSLVLKGWSREKSHQHHLGDSGGWTQAWFSKPSLWMDTCWPLRTSALDCNHCRGKLVCHMCPVPRIVLIEDIWKCFLMNGQISLTRPIFLPWWLISKESACNAGDLGSISGSGRSSGEGNGNPFQYSCRENLIDREAWRATVHGVIRVRHDLVTKPPIISQ